ncbi:MAG: MltF family protein [Planctomycetota bacterium]|jgi:membrane-bound lytic murein transglycosylase MltF
MLNFDGKTFRLRSIVTLVCLFIINSRTLAGPGDAGPGDGTALLLPMEQSLSEDLPEIQNRGYLRVLTTYCETNYFHTLGRERGFEYELVEQYGKFLNNNRSKRRQIVIVYIPTTFDRLIPLLLDGKGDIAAAGLTITPQRAEKVAFTNPYLTEVDEIIVGGRNVNGLGSIEDLSGRTVYVRQAGSYVRHLEMLNEKFRVMGQFPVNIIQADQYLQTEDILEMVNAGIVDLTVADRHIAELWSAVYPDIILRNDIKINTGGKIGWAVRKNNPRLLASLNEFLQKNKKGTLIGNILFKRYYQNTRWIKNPLTEDEQKKLRKLRPLFEKYARKYGFDWLLIAAQGYQESGLNYSARSKSGAVGIMQLLPSTASDRAVNIPNIYKLENNIHAGVKYMAYLRNTFFESEQIAPDARIHFSLAAYNAGPGRVRQFRRRAKQNGLDPDKWFDNVEYAAAEIVGPETVRYVENIHKYYVAYKLSEELDKRRTAGKQRTVTR